MIYLVYIGLAVHVAAIWALCRSSADREEAHEEYLPTAAQRRAWIKERNARL